MEGNIENRLEHIIDTTIHILSYIQQDRSKIYTLLDIINDT